MLYHIYHVPKIKSIIIISSPMKRVPGHPLPGQIFLMAGRRMMTETFLARWTMTTMKTRQERMTGRRRRRLRRTKMVTQLLKRRTWTMTCDDRRVNDLSYESIIYLDNIKIQIFNDKKVGVGLILHSEREYFSFSKC